MIGCVHCGSGDTVPLWKTVQCLNCGKHQTLGGDKILPDSLCIGPNTPGNLAEFGWPYENEEPSHERNAEIMAVQWGTSIRGDSG